MFHFGLIGKSLQHSFSQIYFAERYPQCSYSLFELPSINNLRAWILDNNLNGFNVTIPFKQAIIPLLDSLTPEAQVIGAVNCVKVNPLSDGTITLIGHNTDAPAFQQSLKAILTPDHTQAIILGNGGAVQAVKHALNNLGISHSTLSHQQIDQLHDKPLPPHDILINATPVGTFPNISVSPISKRSLIHNHPPHTSSPICFDLVYNPQPTALISLASSLGYITRNGLEMLHRQADLSYLFWTA